MNIDLLFCCVVAFMAITSSVVNASPDCWRDKNGNIRCVNI